MRAPDKSQLGGLIRAVKLLNATSDQARRELANCFGFAYEPATPLATTLRPAQPIETPGPGPASTSSTQSGQAHVAEGNRIPITLTPMTAAPPAARPEWLEHTLPLPQGEKRAHALPKKESLFEG